MSAPDSDPMFEGPWYSARLARDLVLSLIGGSGMLPHPDEHRTVAREARLLAEAFYAEIANPTPRPEQKVESDDPADVVALEDEGI